MPPGAHMEGKESSAFSTGPVHCMRHALPGQQAGRLAHPGPHGMHARREWPMDVRTVQCMRGTLPQPPRPLHRSDACMIHLATFGVRSHRTVYGVPYPQTTTTYVRIPFKRRERERGACRFVALRTCSLVGSVYIAHAAGGGTEDGWRDVSNTSYNIKERYIRGHVSSAENLNKHAYI